MLSPKKMIALIVATLAFAQFGFIPKAAASCKDLGDCLPVAERDFFILDISTSNDVLAIWRNSLRPSLLRKLQDPFGIPVGSLDQKSGIAPLDVYVSAISSNSASENLNPVFTSQEAREMWGMINDVGRRPSNERLKRMWEEILGSSGVYAKVMGGLNIKEDFSIDFNKCKKSALNAINDKNFISSLSGTQKDKIASTVCGIGSRIQGNLRAIDSRFKSAKCQASKCSDVMGAILNMSKAAADLSAEESKAQRKASLCIAIASDMQHNDPTMKTASILNSRRIAETAKDVQQASEFGRQAANAIGLKFPSNVNVRVFILGEGTGTNPIPLERLQYFNGYWGAFWAQAGVRTTSQAKSLDRACIGTSGKDEN